MPPTEEFPIPPELAGQTLGAILRQRLPGQSWTQVRKLVAARRVLIDDALCLDPVRRLKEEEVLQVTPKPYPIHRGATVDGLTIRHLDDDVVVVEKASGINTVRHPLERDWNDSRRELDPTLQDLTQFAIGERLGKPKHTLPQLRIVQRLDKDTSGLVVFARSVPAERGLGMQFSAHTVVRRYIAIVPGFLKPQSFTSWLVRDRGDGRRGSGPEGEGKRGVTHVDVLERFEGFTMLACQLETGRTHQIRIHLSEAGHSVCGEKVYNRRRNGEAIPDDSEAPRLALHATLLGFEHPTTGVQLQWEMALPLDLQGFVQRLRNRMADGSPTARP